MLTPLLSVAQTATSNIGGAGQPGPSDLVTRGTAGLQLRNRSGRMQANVEYSLSALLYARHDERNTHQNALNALMDLEWLDHRGFLQASATISQGAVSAFGAQPTENSLPSSNVVEVRTIRLAPRWAGPLGSGFRLDANAEVSSSDAQGSTAGDANRYAVQFKFGPDRTGPSAWSVLAQHESSDFSARRSSGTNRVIGVLSRELNLWDLRVSANAGYERGNVISGEQQSAGNWGLGLDWTPSPRTMAQLKVDRRLFGDTHSVTLEHRTPRTVWRFSSSRSLSQTGTDIFPNATGTVEGLYQSLMPTANPDQVKALLAALNVPLETPASAGFLRSASTISNLQQFSAAWRGLRSTATLVYSHNNSRRANALLAVRDDLSLSNTVVTQHWALLLSHRLTPDLTGSVAATYQSGDGDLAIQSSRQRILSAQIGGPLGPRSTWGVVLRRARYEASLVPSDESTAIATYTVRF